MTLTTIRHRLLNLLAGSTLIHDLDVDVEESIYPMAITGDIGVKTVDGDVEHYLATAVINADQSLTIANHGSILAYYPAGTYEGVAAI